MLRPWGGRRGGVDGDEVDERERERGRKEQRERETRPPTCCPSGEDRTVESRGRHSADSPSRASTGTSSRVYIHRGSLLHPPPPPPRATPPPPASSAPADVPWGAREDAAALPARCFHPPGIKCFFFLFPPLADSGPCPTEKRLGSVSEVSRSVI